MQITMRDVENRNIEELGGFLASSGGWEFAGKNQTEIYGWVQKEMVKWEYLQTSILFDQPRHLRHR